MPTIEVTGMGCEGCEDIVQTAVTEVRGVDDATADHENGVVEYDGDADRDSLVEAIGFAGYDVPEADAA